MLDRKNVIKGLQCIIDGTVRCESCGYAIDKHGHQSCQQNCASDAIAILKEKEAVKPLREHSGGGTTWWNICGNCRTAINPNDKFCHECGKAVKWEA